MEAKPRRLTLFARHRGDLLDAQERERVALNKVIQVLVDEVEFLRFMLLNRPHMHPLNPAMEATQAPAGESDRPMWLSEEEEDLLALRINDHISASDVEALESALGVDIHTELESSE